MGNQSGRNNAFPNNNQFGVAPVYTITTPPSVVGQQYLETDWEEYYVPTGVPRAQRPVIYVAAPFPAGGLGGLGGGLGGLGGGLGGLGGGLGGLGGGLGGLGGGLGGLGGGLGGGLPVL